MISTAHEDAAEPLPSQPRLSGGQPPDPASLGPDPAPESSNEITALGSSDGRAVKSPVDDGDVDDELIDGRGADANDLDDGGTDAGGNGHRVVDLDAVVREQLPGLLRYAAALTGDRDVAADVVQEVLVRAHRRWGRIGQLDRPDLYLRRMVTNEHLSWRRRWHVRTIGPAPEDLIAAQATPVADHATAIADRDALQHALQRLTARQRTVLVLRFYEDLDDAEIAEVLGTSPATVRSHASAALARMRPTSSPGTHKHLKNSRTTTAKEQP